MKKIVFDLMVSQPVDGSKFHGGGEYTKTVFKYLCDHFLDEIELTVFYNPDLFIDEWIIEIINRKNINCLLVHSYREVSDSSSFQEADTFVACLMAGVDKVRIPNGMQVIGVYHGFRALEKPIDSTSYLYESDLKGIIKVLVKIISGKMYYKRKYNELLKKVNACTDIVGVSEHSKYAAEVFFPNYPKEHVHCFYSPEKYIEQVQDIETIQVKKRILMLGGNRWVKNLYRGAKALDELFSDGHILDYEVAVVGGIPSLISKRIVNKEKFVSLGYLTPEDLERVYKSCDVFFYPTLNEGFGYPPEEVMKYGTTCVVSAINSLIEIYGESVYYCNPCDLNEMKTRILQAINKKIEESVISQQLIKIRSRQADDLRNLCDLIGGGIT